MKRLIAALAGFALPAIVAAYVALAPLGGTFAPLDLAAERILLVMGHQIAVHALLAMGAVLGLFFALVFGRAEPEPYRLEMLAPDEAEPEWTPTPAQEDAAPLPDPRIAALRRRALPDSAPAELPPPPPVVLVRKPRERERDWFADTSWLGGLPRLGSALWPRDDRGRPLPFAGQIDLVDLAYAAPGNPIPATGSLAFFLGSGAVVLVPEGAHDFSDPPEGLTPAFDEGGAPFPARASRLSRWFFPFWPVDLVALDPGAAASEQAMAAQLRKTAALRDHPFYAAGVGAPVEALWWHSVIHLADQLHEALAASARPIAAQRAALDRKLDALVRLEADAGSAPEAVDHARQTAEYLAEELEETQEQSAALPDMVEALEQFIAGRDPWAPLSPEELEVVADLLSEIHERFGELVRHHVPGSLAQLATLSVRAMVSGPPEALAALPGAMLERINREYRLAPVDQHQMFGPPAGPHAARGGGDILLLQLAYDDMMEWSWGEAGLYQFWIGAEDAAAGNWAAARLTFENG